MKSIICVICLMLLAFTAGCCQPLPLEPGTLDYATGNLILREYPAGGSGPIPPLWSVPSEKAKKLRKQSILKELAKRGKIKTYEVADLLEVSILTAFHYLEELEQEGKIEQIRITRRYVEYKLME